MTVHQSLTYASLGAKTFFIEEALREAGNAGPGAERRANRQAEGARIGALLTSRIGSLMEPALAGLGERLAQLRAVATG